MTLIDVTDKGGWLYSEWKLAYPVGWHNILNAAYALYDTLADPEILVDGKPVKVNSREDIPALAESGTLMIRGMSSLIRVPLMMSFLNQTASARAVVAAATDEFKTCDYKSFNLSMGQLMDSVELAMHRSTPR